ncbi:MAG: polysaccharide biosynthesis tyrosine autokinase [Bacillota bacterium]
MEVQLWDIINRLRKRLLFIILFTLLSVAAAGWVSICVITPKYRADTTLLVRLKDIGYNDVEAHERLMPTYGAIIKSKRTASTVIRRLKLNISEEQLLKRVKVSGLKGSMVTQISVTHRNPRLAVSIADNFAASFRETLPGLMNVDYVRTIDWAELTNKGKPASPKPLFVMAVALALAANTAAGLVILGEVLDKSVKNEKVLQKILDVPVLALIPKYRKRKNRQVNLCCHKEPESFMAEAFRKLRAGIFYLQENRGSRVFLVTSPSAGEGKTFAAINVAAAIARAGKRVLLVDGNLRNPNLHLIFNVSNEWGLSTAFAEPLTFEGICTTEQENLDILPRGPEADPELLTTGGLPDLFQRLKQRYEFVVIDGPPVIPSADALELAKSADAVLLVVKVGVTLCDSVLHAEKSLKYIGAGAAGTIANCVPVKEEKLRVKKTNPTAAVLPCSGQNSQV